MTGTVSQSDSRIFISGQASGINTSALIDAAVQQKTVRADRLDVQIDENVTKAGAYSELESLALTFEGSLAALRGKTGLFDETENVFSLRSGTVATSDGSDFSSLIDVAISSAAERGEYNIVVDQEAQAQRVIGTSVADNTADLGYTGSFTLGLSGNGAAEQIDITADMSLSEIATAINSVSENSGVRASVIKVAENEFQLALTGQETNQTITTGVVAGEDVLNQIGVSDGAGGYNTILQNAQEARIFFDGVEVTRNTNDFSDLVEGLELNIKNAAPGTTISLEIGNDVTSVKDAITGFIDSYNALRDFIVQNQQVSESGVVAEDAILFSDTILEGINDAVSSILAENFNNASAFETIRDLGITIGDNNKLEISDEARLDAAILNDFDAVRDAFASSQTNDNPEFALVQNKSDAQIGDIVFDITVDGGGNITGVTANGDATAFTIDGNRLVGAAGSIYQGLTFAYQGTTSTTVNSNVSQGFADRMINTLKGYTDSVSGLIIQEKVALQDENKGLAEDAQEIRDRAEAFRERQIEKYADFEARLQTLEVLKSQIRAILGNDDDDD